MSTNGWWTKVKQLCVSIPVILTPADSIASVSIAWKAKWHRKTSLGDRVAATSNKKVQTLIAISICEANHCFVS